MPASVDLHCDTPDCNASVENVQIHNLYDDMIPVIYGNGWFIGDGVGGDIYCHKCFLGE